MSGGSMNYVCWTLENEADKLGDRELVAFAKDFAKLLHDREWYLSGDFDEDAWRESAKAFKDKWFKGDRQERLKELVEETFAQARKECLEMIGADEYDNIG